MAVSTPSEATMIVYNVGFGDCVLLRFSYPDGTARHVLVDFGTTKRAPKFRPDSMEAVARKIADDCGGKLQMVVATHRHRDHISGFAGESGRIIAGLQPDLVVQPWTEKPDLAVDATGAAGVRGAGGAGGAGGGGAGGAGGARGMAARRFAARLDTLHEAADQVLQQVPRVRATKGVTRTVADQLAFIGEANLKNADAVRALQALGKRRVYASFGTDLHVGSLLPGVEVEVLGPPTLAQSDEIARMADTDAEEFWSLLAASAGQAVVGGHEPLFPGARKAGTRARAQEARWLIPRIDKMQAEELLALVRILDGVMNNTSLILLFSVGDSRLLFPGDAQLENWRYALELAPEAADIRKRLAATKVYKVGHHGSLNATPRTMLWGGFTRKDLPDPDERLITLLSTTSGKHGDEDHGTEVPRRRLVDELTRRSRLFNTQDCDATTGWWRQVTVPL